ncbi:MAG TPA: hypothetical protein VFV37_06185 [Luteibaculaceae bacterium]|nr:hypothetical protein [Luteibaculaceae bacterium]
MRFLAVISCVLVGAVLGSAINMLIIFIGPKLIAPPEGVDVTTTEGLRAGMALMSPKHFIFPWLAHALGTFVGAWTAGKLMPKKSLLCALLVGGFFMIGGLASAFLLPAPTWFVAVDIALAYLPTAYLAWRLFLKTNP